MIKLKKISKNIFLLFTSLTIFFLLTEIVLRLIIGTSILSHDKNDSDYIQYDKDVKYIYKKNIKTIIKNNDYQINVEINSFGYRDKEWKLQTNNKNILIVGDSYTAGFGINVEDRWPNVLSNLLNTNPINKYDLYNAAVSGYNLEQMEKTIEKLIPIVKPRKVILGLTIDALDRLNDPYVYFHGFSLKQSKAPYAKIYGNELYFHHFKNSFLRAIEYYPLKYSVLYNFIISKLIILKQKFIYDKNRQNNNSVLIKTKNILAELNSKLNGENIKLIILPIIQHKAREKKFSKLVLERYNDLKSFCENNSIQYVDLLPKFKEALTGIKSFWINKDPHWNKQANEVAAKVLFQNLTKEK